MDFTSLEPLPILVFINLLLIAILLLLSRKGLREPYIFSPWRRFLVILLLFIFCLFSFCDTDWFHYAEMYFNILYVKGFNTPLEDVYTLIADISPNYLVFRTIIWGSAVYLLCLLFRHVRVRGDLLLALFCAIWLIDFGTGRVVVAYTMMYLGGAILMKPIKGKMLLFSWILGFTLLCSSLFFHKTALFGVALVVLAFFPRLLNKRTFALFMMMYPFVLLLVQLLLMQFMNSTVDPNVYNTLSTAGQNHLNKDPTEVGIGYLLYVFFRYLPYYSIAWIAYKVNLYQPEDSNCTEVMEGETDTEIAGSTDLLEKTEVPSEVRFFSRLTLYCVLVSTIFLFDLGANTRTVYIRFMMYGFIPACVVLAWSWQHRFYPRLVRLTFLLGMAGTIYTLLYSFYISYLGVAE